jgi:uncharacterized membrane protein
MNLYHAVLGWLHVVFIVVWVGGGLYHSKVLGPRVGPVVGAANAGKLMGGLAQAFGKLVYLSVAVVIVTGFLRAFSSGFLTADFLLKSPQGHILLGKIVLLVVMMINIAIIVKTAGQMAAPPTPDFIPKAQKRIGMLSTTNLVLAAIAIFLAVLLRTWQNG